MEKQCPNSTMKTLAHRKFEADLPIYCNCVINEQIYHRDKCTITYWGSLFNTLTRTQLRTYIAHQAYFHVQDL